jgi:hypothetical protein
MHEIHAHIAGKLFKLSRTKSYLLFQVISIVENRKIVTPPRTVAALLADLPDNWTLYDVKLFLSALHELDPQHTFHTPPGASPTNTPQPDRWHELRQFQ